MDESHSCQRKRARVTPITKEKASAFAQHNLFFALPTPCIINVSTYLLPLHVFNWCQSSLFFHQHVTTNGKILAKELMNVSLTRSLERVLKTNEIGLTISDFKRLHALAKERNCPPFSIALSGSIVLQACLGKPFGILNTDADIFCSQETIHIARKWLVEKKSCNMVLYKLKDRSYVSNVGTYLSNQNEDRIHHVESYGPTLTSEEMKLSGVDISYDHRSLNRSIWKMKEKQQSANKHSRKSNGPPHPDYDFTPTSDYKHAHLVFERHDHEPEEFDDESACCFEYPKVFMDPPVDLVVGSQRNTASGLIESFDLDVCMCSYDGQTFRIQNPSFVFNALTYGGKLIPCPLSNITRNASVLLEFFSGWTNEKSTEERLWNLECAKSNCPLVRYLEKSNCAEDVCSKINEIHVFVIRAVQRINKYRRRGIKVLESDHIPSEYSFHALSESDMFPRI